jgi:hypothetical protein
VGWRRWDDFSAIQLEHHIGPQSHGVLTYRRLGFVPRDAALAEAVPAAERLATGLTSGASRLFAVISRQPAVGTAPSGIHEADTGTPLFERILASVARRVTVIDSRTAVPLDTSDASAGPRDGHAGWTDEP